MMKYILVIILIIVILWNAILKSKKEGFRIMPKIDLPKMPRLKIKDNIIPFLTSWIPVSNPSDTDIKTATNDII